MKFYLSGGMEYKKNFGMVWREWLTIELEKHNHTPVDPVKLESPDVNGNPIQKNLTKFKLEGNLAEVRKIVRENLFPKDMYGIQLADAMVVFYDTSVQHGAGTLAEAWECFREGKPLYLVTEFPLEKVPTWLIGESTQLFFSFEDFLAYVSDENNLIMDKLNAKKAASTALGDIY
jgi:hypothetical protein